ncbi:MAG: aminoacyl-tRNA hydrolase [Candidatus Bipolaricaulota bacterium]|nr:aminoacyl-tRNA hydrolase [Candidatus Bipolaricaulota bacterium]MDW8030598.1 aminoacyl-tRNA hydrolase [Candidatus Bipolaricaulota bacterium]
MKAVIGLGNPGRQYERTRHNMGRLAVRSLLQRYTQLETVEHKLSVVYRIGELALVVEPLTYMNVSGLAVKEICERYSVTPQECLVVYDDYALPFGKLRARKRGSAGGHHGMESVIAELQTEDIPRLRIGIGTEQPLPDLIDYVLGEFTPEEQAKLPEILSRAADAIECFLQTDIETVMNRFNAPAERQTKEQPLTR